jgi:biotin carboxylase
MTKTLLVLAASRYQLDTIRKARALSHRVVTLDNVPSNPGHREADRSCNIDTTDKNAVLEAAIRENIDGVISPCTDVAVPTAAFIAGEMGLPGPPVESALIACSKVLFRRFLSDQGFPAPEALRIQADFLPDEALFEKGRWILKPDRSSGSKGIFIIGSVEEYRRRLPETLGFSPERTGIMERFIEGRQGTCEGFLRAGKIEWSCLLDRLTAGPPYVATRGHLVPSLLPQRLSNRLLTQLENVWQRLRITDGPFDCDFVATEEEVYLIELSPRLGGNCISKLILAATGVDLVECAVHHALGTGVGNITAQEARPAAAVILGVERPGRLAFNREEAARLKEEAWVVDFSLDAAYGDPVQPFINGRNRIGEAMLFGSDRTDLARKVEEFNGRLALAAVDQSRPS